MMQSKPRFRDSMRAFKDRNQTSVVLPLTMKKDLALMMFKLQKAYPENALEFITSGVMLLCAGILLTIIGIFGRYGDPVKATDASLMLGMGCLMVLAFLEVRYYQRIRQELR